MALSDKKYEEFYKTDGTGADKIDSQKLTDVEAAWAIDKAEGCAKYLADPILAPLIFQLQQIQDEITALRTEIDSNKDKVSFEGGSATALSFGEMITVTNPKNGKVLGYHITMTTTKSGVSKSVKLNLV